MASADDYAKWIVDNESKKGTPEFDTVAKAYRLAKSQDVKTPEQKEPLGGATPVGEAAMAMGTGMLSKPLSDVAGLGAIPLHAMGAIKTDPSEVKRKTQEALTYEPRSPEGRKALEIASLPGKPFEWMGEKATQGIEAMAPKGAPWVDPLTSGVREAFMQAPAFLGIKGVPKVAGAMAKGAEAAAPEWMASALKASEKASRTGEEARAIDYMLEKGYGVTDKSAKQMRSRLNTLNNEIAQAIDNSPAIINKKKVASALLDPYNKFLKQVNATDDLAKIEKSYHDFMDHPLLSGKRDIPVKLAHEMKQGTYKALEGKFGELGSADVESQKALARRLKDEVAKSVPQVSMPNAEESRLIPALSLTERRLIQAAKRNPIGMGLIGANVERLTLWMADRSEAFKSLVARMLYRGGTSPFSPVGGGAPYAGAVLSTQPRDNQFTQPPPPLQ